MTFVEIIRKIRLEPAHISSDQIIKIRDTVKLH